MNKFPWQLRVFFAMAFIMSCAGTVGVNASDFPTKPVRLVNPYAPGGAVDLVSRSVGQKLSEIWGQPVIVDNRPGAGTNIGTDTVVRAAPDGYTLLLTSAVIATNISLYKKLPFDPFKDLDPVALIAQSPFILTVHPSMHVNNVSELIALAKTSKKQITFASAGTGTTTHLMLELFKSMSKTNILHVPYKGGGPAINALVSGEVQMTFLPITVVLPQVQAGRLKALAVSSAKRVETWSELPSVSESGLPGFDPIGWYAMFAPANTPRKILLQINSAVNQSLKQKDVRKVLLASGMIPIGGSSDALRDHLKSEISRWGKVIRESGIQAN